jgi:anti-sigma B factor antagonist
MRIDERVHGTALIIEPNGRLTVETEATFTETIRRLIAAGRTRLVLDLAGVPSIDCRGLGAIAHACITVRNCGGDLKLLNVSPRNRHLLTVTKLLTVISTYESEADAERSFSVDRHPTRRTMSDGSHATRPHRIDLQLRAT